MAQSASTLLSEARLAVDGTWRLLAGRSAALHDFDFSERGLAGSFIALICASVLIAGFLGMGDTSGAGLLFVMGALIGVRYGAVYLALPYFASGGALRVRAYMVAANWASAVGVAAILISTLVLTFAGALLLGLAGAEMLVGLILIVWAIAALAALVVEINILRIIAGLEAFGVGCVMVAQGVALFVGMAILGQLPI